MKTKKDGRNKLTSAKHSFRKTMDEIAPFIKKPVISEYNSRGKWVESTSSENDDLTNNSDRDKKTA